MTDKKKEIADLFFYALFGAGLAAIFLDAIRVQFFIMVGISFAIAFTPTRDNHK